MSVAKGAKTPSLLLSCLFLAAVAAAEVSAQAGTVTGAVTESATGRVLSGVQVFIPGVDIGGLTNAQGRFLLQNVPAGQHQITAERIGYRTATQTVDVQAGGAAIVDFRLQQRAISMEEIVVTGVAAETPRSQVPFTVERLDVAEMQRIPTPSVRGLLQGKVPGVKVIQGSGQAGSEPSFQFRGPTSISGNQAPLVVIDGVITNGGIADLNTQDIESMEVVKGAAAAALYGSRAQAGVIQITTKSGMGMSEGQSQITVRQTVEANSLEHLLDHNRGHPWRVDAAGNFLGFDGAPVELPTPGRVIALNDGGDGTNGAASFADQEFLGETFDPMRQFFDPGSRLTTNVAVSGNQGGTQYFVSGAYVREEGAVAPSLKDPMVQRNLRVNLTQPLGEGLTLRLTSYVSDRNRDLLDEQGGFASASGGRQNFVRQLTFLTAKANLLRPDPNEPGGISHIGEPIDVGNVSENPVNRIVNTEFNEDRTRFIGGLDITYEPLTWLNVTGNMSFDRIDTEAQRYQRPGLSRLFRSTKTVGEISQFGELREELNASVTLSSNRQFGDLTVRNRARWLVERLDNSGYRAEGSGLPVDQVPRLGIVTGTPEIDSFDRSIRSEGFFFINQFTYKDRYVGDFLIRRDGSSLFGADERWQTYWRVSGAWRIAQEPWFNVGWIDELKPRVSIGTSGGRPSFEAQYQTFSVERGQLVPVTLGNANLKPELATEKEYGLDVVLAERLRIEANYVDTKVEDQLLLVPQPSSQGFEAQWRNAGTVESTTYELSLEAAIFETEDMSWTARLNLDQTESVISHLNTPQFEFTNPGLSRARMIVKEGERIGSFYGFKFLSSCADLPAGLPCDQFDVNDLGHLVWVGSGNSWQDGVAKGLWGTTGVVDGRAFRWGHPIEPDADSPLAFAKLGDSQPDLNASLSQDFQWRNFGASFLVDGEWGAKIYNFSQQWQCRDWHCKPADMRGVPDDMKKPITYFSALQARNQPNSYFAQDADFVKLREVSLRYTVAEDNMPDMMRSMGFAQATINLVGRNIKTWTDYPGFDPEVGTDTFGGSAVVGRVDEWFVPNFRSFGIDVELIF